MGRDFNFHLDAFVLLHFIYGNAETCGPSLSGLAAQGLSQCLYDY